VKSLATCVGVKDKLREPVAITQVDENKIAVIAVRVNPAGQLCGLAHIGFAKLPASMIAVTGFDGFHGDFAIPGFEIRDS
jgi:hypothetical protein